MRAAQNVTSLSPFLAYAAVPRTSASDIPGYYSKLKDMWVVETDSGIRPVITKSAVTKLLETITKTREQRESDDDGFTGLNHTLELLSKTDTISERDDPGSTNFTLELLTKTNVELEGDDTSTSVGLDTRFYKD